MEERRPLTRRAAVVIVARKETQMSLSAQERERMIEQYATGAQRLKDAVAAVPAGALQWRPPDGGFSVHEVVVHCADSETNAAARIRYLAAEKDPVIMGYDPDNWATQFDYHNHPLDIALATVEAVRANTAALVSRFPDKVWSKEGRHTESGAYTGADWLRIYSEHVEEHIAQIERVAAGWRSRTE
jgi:hypothetical protein